MEGVSYEQGAAHAKKQQAQGVGNTPEHQRILLMAVQVRDALRESERKSAVEQAIEEHLNGYLAQWD